MKDSSFKFHLLALLGAAALLSVLLPYKLSFAPDSITYMEVAENIISGKGITDNEGILVNHWPPLFPILVSLVSVLLNVNVLQAALILQVFLFYIFLLTNMSILRDLKVNSNLIIFFGTCLLLSQVSINFLIFLSEGIFLVLLSLSFFFFLKWIQGGNFRNLNLFAVTCGLFFLSRYAGIAFLGSYLFYMMFFQKEKVNLKIRNLLQLLLIFIIVISPWFIFQGYFDKPPGGRKIAMHVIPFAKIKDMFVTIGYWFLGSRLAIILASGILIPLLLKRKTIKKYFLSTFRAHHEPVVLILIFLLFYPLFLMISISFFDAWTPMSNRILSPLLSFLLILFFLFFQKLLENKEEKLMYTGIVFLLLSFGSSLFPVMKNHFLNGGGYAKKMWVESDVISYLKDENMNIPIYSNGTELGKLHLQQDFCTVPRKNEKLGLKKLKEKVCGGEAQIVFFNEVNWRNYLVSEQELRENFGDEYFLQLEDGFIIAKFTY